MSKYFLFKGIRVGSAFTALVSALLLITSCGDGVVDKPMDETPKVDIIPPGAGIDVPGEEIVVDPGLNGPLLAADWDAIRVLVRTDPAEPQNERFLDDWRFQVFNIDDQARQISPIYYGETGPDGAALIGLPRYMYDLPLVITAYNDVFPVDCPHHYGNHGMNANAEGDHEAESDDHDGHENCKCRQFEIFVPPGCYDQAIWLLGPLENALWDFYKKAAKRRGEAWNPSQVDCGTWLANLEALILTDRVSDELNELSDRFDMNFRREVLHKALQENQQLLVPTRPPICMAERRHNGGGMERDGEIEHVEGNEAPDGIANPGDYFDLDNSTEPWLTEQEPVAPDVDPVWVHKPSGLPSPYLCPNKYDSLSGQEYWEDQVLTVNGFDFVPPEDDQYVLDDEDFMGAIFDQRSFPNGGESDKLDVSSYVTRTGNGRPLDHDKYDDACAVTNIIEFTNKNDDEQDIVQGSGISFSNLFPNGDVQVWLTSDGDAVVGDNDYWAIFYDADDYWPKERVLAVELLGHRQEDFRDVLHMTFDDDTGTLFLGLRADYEMNEEEVDGERAFLAYTIHVWDGSSKHGRKAIRRNIANCYEASDVWARQFFITQDFQHREDECCFDEDCIVDEFIDSKTAAEFAVRSQCFSNSRANRRWNTDDVGYWEMNTTHGVHGNVVINPGWLAPDLDYEIYIQKFDEAVFKGPRTIRRTDDCGQLMVALPTLVEGDRVLIKSEDNCCDDYDVVLPCVPEFTGFAGAPGLPYVPVTVGPTPPPPPPPAPVPGNEVGAPAVVPVPAS